MIIMLGPKFSNCCTEGVKEEWWLRTEIIKKGLMEEAGVSVEWRQTSAALNSQTKERAMRMIPGRENAGDMSGNDTKLMR